MLELAIALSFAVVHARLSFEFNPQTHLELPEHSQSKLEADTFRERRDDALNVSATEMANRPKTDDDDIVDREDVTQYLTELLVNTDSEITILEANEEFSETPENNESQNGRNVGDLGSQ